MYMFWYLVMKLFWFSIKMFGQYSVLYVDKILSLKKFVQNALKYID